MALGRDKRAPPSYLEGVGHKKRGNSVCRVLLVYDSGDATLAQFLKHELRFRQLLDAAGEYGTAAACPGRKGRSGARPQLVLALIPRRGKTAALALALKHIGDLLENGLAVSVIIPDDQRLDAKIAGRVRDVIRAGWSSTEHLLEAVFDAITQPRPSWLSARVRPMTFSFPGGVGWWGDEMAIVDGSAGRVVTAGERGESVVYPGLADPQHLKVDRTKLLIADKSNDRLVLARIEDGRVAEGQSLESALGTRFLDPTGVDAALRRIALADTGNDRVLISGVNPFRSGRSNRRSQMDWTQLEYKFNLPCGVLIDDYLWVANTFDHTVVAFSSQGKLIRSYRFSEVKFPVHVASWSDLLFIASESGVFTFKKTPRGGKNPILTPLGQLAPDHVTAAFALSVNVQGRMAISDRVQHCVWIVDLAELRSSLKVR